MERKHVPLSSVLLSLRSGSTHGKTAPCSLHFKSYQGLMFSVAMTDFHQLEKMRGKETCRVAVVVLLALQKSSPPRLQLLTDNIVTLLASFTVGLLAENTEQNLIADINNKYTHSRRFRRNVSHLHMLLCLDNSLASSHFLSAHRSR